MRSILFSCVTIAAALLTGAPAAAQDIDSLPPQLAEGRLLFEETAGDIGCASCHGMDATGTETAPDIRGANEGLIMQNLRINNNMEYLALSTEDLEALTAYLAYLVDSPLR